MTTYTAIPNGDVDQDSPVTQPLLTLLRDNPLAIVEGTPGAPKINAGALERPTAGTAIRARYDAETSLAPGGSLQRARAFGLAQVGTVRLSYEHMNDTSNGNAEVRRIRGGTGTQLSIFGNTGAFVTRTIDVDILPGDTIEVRISGSGGSLSRVRNTRIQTNGENLWPATVDVPVEGNTYA